MPYDVSKLWSQKDIEQSIEGWGATEYYSVTGTPTELADNLNLLIAPGIPAIGQSHPTRRDLRVMSKQAGSGLAERIISVRYAWLPAGIGGGGTSATTLIGQQPRISWSKSVRQESLSADIHGQRITNSAGDAVDPPPVIDRSSRILRITRHERNYNPELADRLEDTINSHTMYAGKRAFPRGTVRLLNMIPAEEYAPDAESILIQYEFEIRTRFATPSGSKPTAFDVEPFLFWVIDVGLRSYYTKSTNTPSLEPGDLYNADSAEDQVTEPVRLQSGAPMQLASYKVTSSTLAPVKSKLGLPTGSHKPRYVQTPDNLAWAIGWEIYHYANLLELGL